MTDEETVDALTAMFAEATRENRMTAMVRAVTFVMVREALRQKDPRDAMDEFIDMLEELYAVMAPKKAKKK